MLKLKLAKYLLPAAALLLFAACDKSAITVTPATPGYSEIAVLAEGNTRYVRGESRYFNQAAAGETPIPFAAVLSCGDMDTSVERLFDAGPGDLLVMENIGNAWNRNVAINLEAAVTHLNITAVVVLGHTDCGAVKTAWRNERSKGDLAVILAPVFRAVTNYRIQNPAHGGVNDAVGFRDASRANICQTVQDIIDRSPVIRARYMQGKLVVQPAEYDAESKQVTFLPFKYQPQVAPDDGRQAMKNGK